MSRRAGRVGHSRIQKSELVWLTQFAVSIYPVVQHRRPAVLLLELHAPGVIAQLSIAWRPVVFQKERDQPCRVLDASSSNPAEIASIDSQIDVRCGRSLFDCLDYLLQ